jgi:hypothetical protein
MTVIEMEEKGAELLKGVVDIHLYAEPCVYERMFNEIDLAKQARDAGYRAMLIKCHHAINADRAQNVMKMVAGIGVYGGVVLNYFVGGLNPEAVEAAIALGAKEIWMPNMHSAHHIEIVGSAEYTVLTKRTKTKRASKKIKGISIFTLEGKLRPEVYEILDLIANANIILGTGHLSIEEVFALVKAAKDAKVERILVQHPESYVTKWPIEKQVAIAKAGAILEHNFAQCDQEQVKPAFIAQAIKAAKPSQCVMASGLGQIYGNHPIDGMRQFIRLMLREGISENDIDLMARKRPAELLGLE